MVMLLALRADCSRVALKPAHLSPYLPVAATDSGSHAPVRTIRGSSWRRDDWRLYATARTDNHLSGTARHQRTSRSFPIRPRDRHCTGLLDLDGTQMATAWTTAGACWPHLSDGSAQRWATEHASDS